MLGELTEIASFSTVIVDGWDRLESSSSGSSLLVRVTALNASSELSGHGLG